MDEKKLSDLVGRLTLEQKVALLTGEDFWSLRAEPEVGLRKMLLSDGPAGVRGTAWDERAASLLFPNPTALAATWRRTSTGTAARSADGTSSAIRRTRSCPRRSPPRSSRACRAPAWRPPSSTTSATSPRPTA